jgi:hypothetical protein
VNLAEGGFPPAICASLWTEESVADWVTAWNPPHAMTGIPTRSDGPAVSSPLVERGLEAITESRNPATGLGHPSDERMAKRILKALALLNEPLDETEIRTWAMSKGCPPEHARELAELAGKLAARRPVKGASMIKTEARAIVEPLNHRT